MTGSLFARFLVVVLSGPKIDLKESISEFELSTFPRALFSSDGNLRHCIGRSKLTIILENFQYPKGVNRRDHRIKMVLAARHKISMEEVEARLKQGTLSYTIHSSNEDWVDSIGGEAELKNFLIEAGVSDTAIDQTFNPPYSLEESTSSATEATETQEVSGSNDETSVESRRSLKENGAEVPTSDQKESNVKEHYETEEQLIERYGREEGLKRLRERGSHIADEPEFKQPDIPSTNPNKDQ